MPIENEQKYVLRDPAEVSDLWPISTWQHIRQAYLPGDARIRQTVRMDRGKLSTTSHFTYKMMTASGLVEIETVISELDFLRLWEVADRAITKRRRAFIHEDEIWDIDVFYVHDAEFKCDIPYYAMAECEMPEGRLYPLHILPAIAPFIQYTVPPERVLEFTNTRLSPSYCATLDIKS